MLSKENRLTRNKDFQKILKEGRKFQEGFLFLKILENNLEIPRFGFIVSNKVSKKATIRNKIKRKLRELVRLKLPRIKTGVDGIILITSNTENFGEIQEKLNKIFLKAKLIR